MLDMYVHLQLSKLGLAWDEMGELTTISADDLSAAPSVARRKKQF